MYGNGAGTGMEHIRAARKQIQEVRLQGLTACCAAGAGSIRLLTCVPRTDTTVLRLPGAAMSASVLSAISLMAMDFAVKPDSFRQALYERFPNSATEPGLFLRAAEVCRESCQVKVWDFCTILTSNLFPIADSIFCKKSNDGL